MRSIKELQAEADRLQAELAAKEPHHTQAEADIGYFMQSKDHDIAWIATLIDRSIHAVGNFSVDGEREIAAATMQAATRAVSVLSRLVDDNERITRILAMIEVLFTYAYAVLDLRDEEVQVKQFEVTNSLHESATRH